MERLMRSAASVDKSSMMLAAIAFGIVAIMLVISPSFIQANNISSMAFQFPEFGLLCFGMMLAMISGGIDLSLVGTANLSGIIASLLMLQLGNTGFSIFAGFIIALVIGAICGLINGLLIGQMQIPAMLVTLCGGQLYTGLGVAITKGPAITGLPDKVLAIANGSLFNAVPYSLIIFILLAVFINYLLKHSTFGRKLSFLGTNITAARYSGINTLKVTITTYMISGALAAVAGMLIISHYGSAKSDYGTSYTLLTLLIVVLGGVDPSGGKGKVLDVSLAIIVLQLISSSFNILRFNSFVKTFVWGLLLITVMSIKSIIKLKKVKPKRSCDIREKTN